jgi:hypothetical protein
MGTILEETEMGGPVLEARQMGLGASKPRVAAFKIFNLAITFQITET